MSGKTAKPAKNFNLPWHQHDHYWISVYPKGSHFLAPISEFLENAHMTKTNDGGMAIRAPRDWKSLWDNLYAGLEHVGALDHIEAAVTPGNEQPRGRMAVDCKAPQLIQVIADSLWIGEALLENRILCFMQQVVDDKGKIFGYESFARVRSPDGDVIGGEQIFSASKALGIEFMIDRHLHIQAIKTFVSSSFNGFLFVNFFPGFIHRPAIYLEGLAESVKTYGVIAKHIVLDFTKSETSHDVKHMKSVCEYGRSCGYSIALDDISTVESARRLVDEVRPDFVKIDMHLIHKVAESSKRNTIKAIVDVVHDAGGTVIAEGVESDEIYDALKKLGVNLFQGYLFSPPVPVEAALKQSGAGA